MTSQIVLNIDIGGRSFPVAFKNHVSNLLSFLCLLSLFTTDDYLFSRKKSKRSENFVLYNVGKIS